MGWIIAYLELCAGGKRWEVLRVCVVIVMWELAC